MNRSTKNTAQDRAVLCQRGGELAEFAPLLSELGFTVETHTGDLPGDELLVGARLVIVAGQRLAEGRVPAVQRWPRTIAVVDDGSKTLAAHLNRIGVAMVVRRPIHPRALRLLMLHELYRGPERRIRKRILIGHPIRTGVGLFKQDATLLELSRTGARISLVNPPKIGTTIQFVLGKELTHSQPIKIQAKVVRCVRPSSASGHGECEIGLSLSDAGDLARPIQAILNRFASGPASIGTAPRSPLDTLSTRMTSAPVSAPASTPSSSPLPTPTATRAPQGATLPPTGESRRLPPSYQADLFSAQSPPAPEDPRRGASTPAALAETTSSGTTFDAVETEIEILDADFEVLETGEDSDADLDFELDLDEEFQGDAAGESMTPGDRRQSVRVPYAQRVVALGEQAARVVVGRDLCFGGMRIAANPAFTVGDVLRIALHAGTETEPLVVLAGVERDDGDDGLVLAFAELTGGQRDRLEKILSASSAIQSPGDFTDEVESLIVGELLARVARGRSSTGA